jgi:hypothetical protein
MNVSVSRNLFPIGSSVVGVEGDERRPAVVAEVIGLCFTSGRVLVQHRESKGP